MNLNQKGHYALRQVANPVTNDLTVSSQVICINSMSVGSGQTQRRGNWVDFEKVTIAGNFRHETRKNAIPAYSGNAVRLCLVWDKSPNGELPNWDLIFGHSASVVGTWDPIQFNFADRFQLLLDERIDMHYTAYPGDDPNSESVNFYPYQYEVSLEGLSTQYQADDVGDVAAISSGALYYVIRAVEDTVYNSVTLWIGSQSGSAVTYRSG